MNLNIRYEAIIYLGVRQCRGILVSIMPVLGGEVYFPVLVFDRFRVIGDKGWTGQDDCGHKCEDNPENSTEKNNRQYASHTIDS
jgi:hypothetical protein